MGNKGSIVRYLGRCEHIEVCCFNSKDCLTEKCGLYVRIKDIPELDNPVRIRLYINEYASGVKLK